MSIVLFFVEECKRWKNTSPNGGTCLRDCKFQLNSDGLNVTIYFEMLYLVVNIWEKTQSISNYIIG